MHIFDAFTAGVMYRLRETLTLVVKTRRANEMLGHVLIRKP
jgi:hypothetical protein